MRRLALISKGEIKVLGSLPDEECRILVAHIETVNRFRDHINRLRLVTKPYDDIRRSLISNSRNNDDLIRLILEFLNAFRTYLNHCETYLKRTYGKTANEYKAFEAATHTAYDSLFAYRFFCEFRNYVQHCEFPKISMTSEIGKSGDIVIRLYLDRQELLTQFNWKSTLKADIEHLPAKIEFLSILDQVTDSIKNIHQVMFNSEDLVSLSHSSAEILKYKHYQNESSKLALIEYVSWHDAKTPKSIDIEYLPFELAEHVIGGIQ